MKQKIRQIIYDVRRQPLISGVTFVATAMSVFLFMIVVITTRVKVIPFAPESCRDRLMIGEYIHLKNDKGNSSSGGLGYTTARKLYGNLDGVEQESYFQFYLQPMVVRGTVEKKFTAQTRSTDAGFFKVFDHLLISGRYFTVEEANANLPVVVISESTARRAFDRTDCVGMPVSLNYRKYTVVGVVRDNSALATNGCGEVFIAKGPDTEQSAGPEDVFGDTGVALLVKDGVDFNDIRKQVKARYALLDTELAPTGKRTVYHEGPYDQQVIADGFMASNTTPDPSVPRKIRLILYAVLLIVPAITLSCLLHSRMRKRISEIGVRRAYGCTRARVITDIVWENFLVTFAGGLVGVCIGVIFALTYSGLYEGMDSYGTGLTPAVSSVINWGTILIAVAACFVLNLISALVPAWQASRYNPVEAINTK